jgi:hypothetical protein
MSEDGLKVKQTMQEEGNRLIPQTIAFTAINDHEEEEVK